MSLEFSQDQSCFTVCSELGFSVYNTHPLRLCYNRNFSGGIQIAEILNRSNIVALVGGGKSPRFHPNRVIFWDDYSMRSKSEFCMRNQVRGVKLRRDRIVVVLQTKLYVFNFYDMKLRDKILTSPNPRGLCALSSDPEYLVMACPDMGKGRVLVKHYYQDTSISINMFSESIAAIAINSSGQMVAAACTKGTIIKVFDTISGEVMHEFRRGIDRADVLCLAFHPNSQWLGCSSDRGTVHVFSITNTDKPKLASFMGPILPKYFNSTISYAHFKVKDSRCVCGFVSDQDYLVVVDQKDWTYYLVDFSDRKCTLLFTTNLLDVA